VPIERRARDHPERASAEAEARVDTPRDALVNGPHDHGARADGPEDAAADRSLDLTDSARETSELVEAERGQGAEFAVTHEVQLGGEVIGPFHESYLDLAEELGLTIVPSFPQLPGEDTWVLADGRHVGDNFPG
jgi:hypothetical protein